MPLRRDCRCLECGEGFTAHRRREFCSRACTRAWNNRRMVRGAMLYDLVMILREDRKLATLHKVWRTINRLARHYRDEDETGRAGRRSWRPLAAIKQSNPWLWAE